MAKKNPDPYERFPLPPPTIIEPERATMDLDTGCSWLFFPKAHRGKPVSVRYPGSIAPDGYYQMAGGICWPMLVKGVFKGAVLIAGRSVETGKVYVFEQREFASVDHIYSLDGELIEEGLAASFPRWWATYFLRRFYWFQTDEWNATFRRRLRHSPLVEPRPSLVEVHWRDSEHVALMVSDATARRELMFKGGGILESQLDQMQADPEIGPFPAVHALACLLTGLAGKRRIRPSDIDR